MNRHIVVITLAVVAGCGQYDGADGLPASRGGQVATPSPSLAVEYEAGHPSSSRPQFEMASFVVPIDSACTIRPEGRDRKNAIRVPVDEDGVARFFAVRPTRVGAVDRLALECTLADGTTTYSIDLRDEVTFAPRPLNPPDTRGPLRPAIDGDPLAYSIGDLIRKGFGVRPDPVSNPNGYARWLESANKPMRRHGGGSLAGAPGSSAGSPKDGGQLGNVDAGTAYGNGHCGNPACYWTGVDLEGEANPSIGQGYTYNSGQFRIPTLPLDMSGLDESSTEMSIWTGLDDVFQTEVFISAFASTVASIFLQSESFLPPGSGSRYGTFMPSQGDNIIAEEWYCDDMGNLNLNGGWGCTYLADTTTGESWECDRSDDGSFSSYPMSTGLQDLGLTAEFIIENDSDQVSTQDGSVPRTDLWPDFMNYPITMTGETWVYTNNTTFLEYDTPTTDSVVLEFGDIPWPGFTYLPEVIVSLPATTAPDWAVSWTMAWPQLSIFVRSTGEVDLAAQGANNTLWYYWNTGSGWHSEEVAVAGTTYSAPSLAVSATGVASIAVQGANNSLQYYSAPAGDPFTLVQRAGSGTTYSKPAVFVRTTGEVDIAFEGSNNTLQYQWNTGSGWHAEQAAGSGTTYSAPSLGVNSAARPA